ncbi:hypothetical protein [Absidia glauca]|uniref:Uncharacterized protein n=1 Tax=Absidia glauca TaxID=4829 RepID=A0A168MJK2_ABSGL|nr:hypothetical protein [Absidia glauca]
MPQLKNAMTDAFYWISQGQKVKNEDPGKKRKLLSLANRQRQQPRSNNSRKMFSRKGSPQQKSSPGRKLSLSPFNNNKSVSTPRRPLMMEIRKAMHWFSPSKKQRRGKAPAKKSAKFNSRLR